MLCHMCTLTLFAYLPRRGVIDALLVIFDFCNMVRQQCQQVAPGPWKTRISTFGRLRSTRDGLDQSGFLRNINLDRIQRAMSVFEPLPKTSTDDQDFFACPYCDINPLMYIDTCRNGTKHISCTNVSSHSEMRKEVDQNVPTAPNALPPGRPCDSHSTRSLFSILSQT